MLRMLIRFRDIYEKADLRDQDLEINNLRVAIEKKKKSNPDDKASKPKNNP
jgi:hypothetical protein